MIIRLAKVLCTRVLLNISAKKHLGLLVFGLFCVIGESSLQAQTTSTNSLGFNFQLPDNPQEFDLSIRIVIFFTLLAIAPSLMIMMTCFTRIVIVLSFLRTALALQQAPSNQLLVSFALFLTFFIMGPVF
jgi:flagellar biosynthetic protein FliP